MEQIDSRITARQSNQSRCREQRLKFSRYASLFQPYTSSASCAFGSWNSNGVLSCYYRSLSNGIKSMRNGLVTFFSFLRRENHLQRFWQPWEKGMYCFYLLASEYGLVYLISLKVVVLRNTIVMSGSHIIECNEKHARQLRRQNRHTCTHSTRHHCPKTSWQRNKICISRNVSRT